MNKITIHGSSSYEVIIQQDILSLAGELLSNKIGGEKALIVTDANVGGLYLNTLADSLREVGYEIVDIVLPAGELSKDVENYIFLLEVLAKSEFSSSDIIIALGGGVIGDLAGFVASTYRRGTQFVQIPTTLLAAVDSSIGGKNAINLPTAKNQVGTIRNPSLVICDPAVMATLSNNSKLDGYAEILKYGILSGNEIINSLRQAIIYNDYSDVISHSIRIKKSIIEMDENDQSFRQYLNLGHLIGHAIEAYSDYHISHGIAVSYGLALETRACAFAGYTSLRTYNAITDLLREFDFDIEEPYRFEDLIPYIMRDKRIRSGVIQILVPIDIGECIMRPLKVIHLSEFIKLAF
ncbi:MAG: 3-dehydroquinate synthase [Clostridiales bacterium]|nr:3-dehydroquinate synthase [Clostridiales bacterium]